MSSTSGSGLEGLELKSRGKVRDIYDLGDYLLLVASDRVSAFDFVLPTPIPDKGAVLTGLSRFWFERLADVVTHHMVTTDVEAMPAAVQPHADALRGRTMLVRKLEMVPFECVVRGYLAGSGWKDYQRTGGVCGIELPSGLELCSELPDPIFTPARKAITGHDENVSFEVMREGLGAELADDLKRISLELYTTARAMARERGILLADTKFEFGLLEGRIVLGDELFTPDSSRYWPADDYAPGRDQKSLDKQYVRNHLIDIGWDRQPPVPALPDEVVSETRRIYLDIYQRLTGTELPGT